ncbi:MAG: class I SAM-dependent methyltransferase, partial [Comamonadaceae bacterium]|nr:class I SAM-dependent methyltransferase [Comamonadaceae bacterium]
SYALLRLTQRHHKLSSAPTVLHLAPRPRPRPTSPPSSSASRPPGPAATSPSSAPRCRSSASRSAEAADVRAGERVLDVAAGNGNATLAAARRFADVTSTDYVPALLDKGRERARGRGPAGALPRSPTPRTLPFADGSFDVVLSTFGAMFTPDHARAAREMLRVLRAGGRIGLANWTPGRLHRPAVQGRSAPTCRRPPACKSPALWGTEPHIVELFGAAGRATSAASAGTSTSATARRRTGCRCSATSTARRTRPSRRSTPPAQPALERDITGAARGAERRRAGLAGRAQRVPRSRHHASTEARPREHGDRHAAWTRDAAAPSPRLGRRAWAGASAAARPAVAGRDGRRGEPTWNVSGWNARPTIVAAKLGTPPAVRVMAIVQTAVRRRGARGRATPRHRPGRRARRRAWRRRRRATLLPQLLPAQQAADRGGLPGRAGRHRRRCRARTPASPSAKRAAAAVLAARAGDGAGAPRRLSAARHARRLRADGCAGRAPVAAAQALADGERGASSARRRRRR